MNQLKHCCLAALVSLFCCCTLPKIATASENEEWKFRLSPYAWLAGQSGSVATLPGLPPVDIDVDFWDDILGNINGALFLVGEARKEKWGVFIDLAYVDIESDNPSPTPAFSSIDSTTTSWIVSAVGFHRLTDRPDAFVDLTAGVRYCPSNPLWPCAQVRSQDRKF